MIVQAQVWAFLLLENFRFIFGIEKMKYEKLFVSLNGKGDKNTQRYL